MSLRFETGGESHGKGGLAFLEGLPKGLLLDLEFVNSQLARRQRGYGRSGRQGIEKDSVEILGGTRALRCLEAPLLLWIANRDATIEERDQLPSPRPGHADLAGCLRHGDRDIRANLERASARETAARVAAGAVAQLLLRSIGCEVLGHVVGIGGVVVPGEPGLGLERVITVDARFNHVFIQHRSVAASMVNRFQAMSMYGVADALDLGFVHRPPKIRREEHAVN